MKLTNWAFAIVIAMFALTGCTHSSPGIQVRDHNIAHMTAGQTLQLKFGKGLWTITYAGENKVHFDHNTVFSDPFDVTLDVGQTKTVDSEGFFTDNFTVTRTDRTAIEITWPDGMTYLDMISGVVPVP